MTIRRRPGPATPPAHSAPSSVGNSAATDAPSAGSSVRTTIAQTSTPMSIPSMTPLASADGGGRGRSPVACPSLPAWRPVRVARVPRFASMLPTPPSDLRTVRSLLDGRPSTGSPRCCMSWVVRCRRSVAWTVVGDPPPLADRQQGRAGGDHAQAQQHQAPGHGPAGEGQLVAVAAGQDQLPADGALGELGRVDVDVVVGRVGGHRLDHGRVACHTARLLGRVERALAGEQVDHRAAGLARGRLVDVGEVGVDPVPADVVADLGTARLDGRGAAAVGVARRDLDLAGQFGGELGPGTARLTGAPGPGCVAAVGAAVDVVAVLDLGGAVVVLGEGGRHDHGCGHDGDDRRHRHSPEHEGCSFWVSVGWCRTGCYWLAVAAFWVRRSWLTSMASTRTQSTGPPRWAKARAAG